MYTHMYMDKSVHRCNAIHIHYTYTYTYISGCVRVYIHISIFNTRFCYIRSPVISVEPRFGPEPW